MNFLHMLCVGAPSLNLSRLTSRSAGPALYSSARITNRTEDALTSPIKDAKLEEATAVNEADSDEDLANEQDKRPARTAEDAFLGEETIGFSDNESKATGNGKEDEGHSTAREGTIEPNSGRDEEPTRFPSDKLQTTSSRITKPPSPTSMLDSGSGDRHSTRSTPCRSKLMKSSQLACVSCSGSFWSMLCSC